MALRDQPYLPLYIQDIMTDEKLNECCAATHGVYIKGIMCLMHKSEEYGKILLKQKDQQTDNKVKNFALKIAKHTPYSEEEIEAALFELLAEKVLYIDGESLCQKRMINDNAISQARSVAGKTSAEVKKTKKSKGKKFVATKVTTNNSTTPSTKTATNPENEIEYESDNEVELKSKKGVPPTVTSEVTQFPVEQKIEQALSEGLDELYIDKQRPKWTHIDFEAELTGFFEKVRGSPGHYQNHDAEGMRLAFQSQLRKAPKKSYAKGNSSKNDRTEFNQNELDIIRRHASGSQ